MRYDRAANVDDTPCGCQRMPSAMSPPVLPRPEEAHRAHIGFARTVRPCRIATVVTPCRCSHAVVDAAVDAVVVTRSLPSSRSRLAEKSVRGRYVSILWTRWRRYVDDDVDEDIGDEVSTMALQRRVNDNVSLEGVPRVHQMSMPCHAGELCWLVARIVVQLKAGIRLDEEYLMQIMMM